MSDGQAATNFYALLIGINCYLPNRLPGGLYYKSLMGCVQDIQRVRDFLREKLSVPAGNIVTLTASNGDTARPTEPPELWPTYANIVGAFRRLCNIARPGDLIYIHYSGHGGRAVTAPEHRDLKGEEGVDEVLVPTDIGNSEAQYLRDIELAHLLKQMVDKKLVVTVVLDSCHAGGSTRANAPLIPPEAVGAGLRGVGVIDETPRPSPSLVAAPEELAETWRNLSKRATRALTAGSGWLLEPEGYVLLAACRASEYANEYPFEGGQKNGALTYWLLDSLKQLGTGLTYKTLHDRVLAKVRSQFAGQTPQLQGEGDRIVFGTEHVRPRHAVTVMSVEGHDGDTLSLNAGQAHSVRKGAQFIVHQLGATDFTQGGQRVALAEVTEVGAVDSKARVIKRFNSLPIRQGCQAVLTEPGAIRLCRSVRVFPRADEGADADSARALREVEGALAALEGGFVLVAPEREAADYLVTLNARGEYVICDAAGQELPNLPPLKAADAHAAARVAERLVHLIRYRNIRELDNADPMSPLARKLVVELKGVQEEYEPGEQPEPRPFTDEGGPHTVRDGEWTFMSIRNDFSQVLNITVLNLQPDWGISQIYPARSAYFEPLDPGREILLPLRATLPPGYEEGIDIIKVFGTVGTTNFRWLELPALDQPVGPDAAQRSAPANPLEELLSAFSRAHGGTRNVNPATFASAEWTTVQVELEVRRQRR